MHRPKKVVVNKKRSVYTYSELWHASNCVLKSGIENPTGCSWQFLSSILLTAFSFEAYLNHVGQRTIKCWEQLERLPPWSKFELLCESLEITFPDGTGKRPLQTVTKLLDFRNTIAHGKSLEIVANPETRDVNDNLDHYLGQRTLTSWEEMIQTKDFPERVREDVKLVITNIHDARKDEKEHLFTMGMQFYSATLAQESRS